MSRNDLQKHKNVAEMLRDTAAEGEAITTSEFHDYVGERKLVKELAILRSARGLSQQDVAESIKCTQSWVSKIENGKDDELTIGELRKYFDALGLEFRPGAVKKGATLVDETKQLAFAMRGKFNKLASLAQEGDEMVESIANFFMQAFINLNTFLSEAAAKLPNGPASRPCISIGMEDLEFLEGTNALDRIKGVANCRLTSCEEALHN
jgi:transcriptional regulator with XRE-family HTH domain